MSKLHKFQWTHPGSVDDKVLELIHEPSEQFLRIINSYGDMAASEGCSFGFSQPIDLMNLGASGLILDEVRNNGSFEPFRALFKERLAFALTADQQQLHPTTDVMAEASAAVLLQRQGWIVEKLPEGKTRTPDLMARRGTCEMEVEVVVSRMKYDEEQRHASIQRRLEEVPRRSDATIAVAVVDELSDQEVDDVAAAAERLSVGEIAEARYRWRVSVISPDQQDAEAPDWWPKQYTQPFITSVRLNQNRITERITFRWGLSYSAYRNSPLRKIERSQFTGTHPSLIAWDRGELAGAIHWARENGLELLGEHNSHISGLLTYGLGMTFSGEAKWWYILLHNPHARLPLPANVMDATEGEIAVRLWGSAP